MKLIDEIFSIVNPSDVTEIDYANLSMLNALMKLNKSEEELYIYELDLIFRYKLYHRLTSYTYYQVREYMNVLMFNSKEDIRHTAMYKQELMMVICDILVYDNINSNITDETIMIVRLKGE